MFGNRAIAAILAILLGWTGAHKFYTGRIFAGLIMLILTGVLTLLTFGLLGGVMGLIGIVEGIIYILKSDEDFQRDYVDGNKGWF